MFVNVVSNQKGWHQLINAAMENFQKAQLQDKVHNDKHA